MDDTADLADNQDDLERFLNAGWEIRPLMGFPGEGLAGIAIRGPQDWDWRVVRLEGEAGREFRETATALIADQLVQRVPGFSPPSGLDDALDRAAAVLSPQIVLGKLANAATRIAVCHVGFPHIAAAAGKAAEQVVAALPVPDGMPGRALDAARDCVVSFDVAGGHLTATVRDFIADKEAGRINDLARGVTRSQADGVSLRQFMARRSADPSLPRPDPPSQPPAGSPPPPPPSPALPRSDDPTGGPGGLRPGRR